MIKSNLLTSLRVSYSKIKNENFCLSLRFIMMYILGYIKKCMYVCVYLWMYELGTHTNRPIRIIQNTFDSYGCGQVLINFWERLKKCKVLKFSFLEQRIRLDSKDIWIVLWIRRADWIWIVKTCPAVSAIQCKKCKNGNL